MAIERIHFEGGLEIVQDIPADLQIRAAALAFAEAREALPEGSYDLTPEWWEKHHLRHTLRVLPDGTGIFRGYPRFDDVGTTTYPGRTYRRGGITTRLPADDEIVSVSGTRPDRKTLGIYEIVLFQRGPNPPKRA